MPIGQMHVSDVSFYEHAYAYIHIRALALTIVTYVPHTYVHATYHWVSAVTHVHKPQMVL